MNSPARYRSIRFGIKGVHVNEAADGSMRVTTPEALHDYPLRLTDRLHHWAKQAPDRSYMAQRDPRSGQWRHISYAQALQLARHIGQGLLNRGLSAERPVLILSDNDLEHAMLALACQYVGVPFAPISPPYSLLSKDFDKLRHIMQVLTPGLLFAANGEKFGPAVRATAPNDFEFVVTEAPCPDRATTLLELLATTPITPEVDAAHAATGPDTIVKFLFTSGSTSMPKAVVNTQRMMCSNLQMMLQTWPFLADEPPVLVDWLPWNHTFGGNHNVGLVMYNGGTLYIDEGKPTPAGMAITLANLRDVAPTLYFNVPKGWEELAWALEADAQLSKTFHSRLKMQFFAGASLPQPVWDKLHAVAEATCGERIVMTCGLGMTETAPSALFVVREEVSAGQIGIPLPGTELKLLPHGDKTEVRYRGPNVTPGYWRAPEQTRAAFDEDGFFCSGDAVKWFDPAHPDLGFVFDGRVAEDFKLYTGTWVSVGPLRLRIAHEGAPYVQETVITGHDRAEVGMLVLPNLAHCRTLAGLDAHAADATVLASPAVRAFFQTLVDRLAGQGTGSANRITRALILTEPLSMDKGEVTDKGSVNQHAILKHRAALVEAMYAGTDPATIVCSQASAASR